MKEIYLGEANVDPINFPELTFVEEVYETIVAKRKSLGEVSRTKSTLDTDNWFPINPLDYKINPWLKLNSLQSEKEIGNELVKNLFLRVALLKNYSRFNVSNGLGDIKAYATLDAIAMNKTILSDNIRSIILNDTGGVLKEINNQLNNPSRS